ncbi:hypothetical protein DBR43_10640 [Pedobacter sp. KBW06]|nr:hypothetical protein DBR43_10640 [Pedobacter sp. KBW06]
MIAFLIINTIYIYILGSLVIDSIQKHEPGYGVAWNGIYSLILHGTLTGITILIYIFLNWKIVKKIILP